MSSSQEYRVIARKYRPGCFADVVGQEHVVRTLKNSIRSGRTAHAYLLVGPRGIGKTTLARIFAKALSCKQPEDGEPCGKCPSCQAIADGSSLDVIEVDAASRNSTGDMRELAEDVLTRPVAGRYKIYIIDEVHMLSKAAWNVLLKTVEEPPSHVKFIFATTEVHQVLPTIISRCQRFDLLPIPTELIRKRLRLIADNEKVNISDGALNAIARAADGGMRDAQSLLDQMIAFFSSGEECIDERQVLSLFGLTDRSDLLEIVRAMLDNRPGDVVRLVAGLSGKGKNLETLFDDLLSLLRSLYLAKILPDPMQVLNVSAEDAEYYRKISREYQVRIFQIILESLSVVGRVLHDALNKQVFLETALLKAMREAHAICIDDILHRLNQLRRAGELKFLDQVPVVAKTPALRHEEQPQPFTPGVSVTPGATGQTAAAPKAAAPANYPKTEFVAVKPDLPPPAMPELPPEPVKKKVEITQAEPKSSVLSPLTSAPARQMSPESVIPKAAEPVADVAPEKKPAPPEVPETPEKAKDASPLEKPTEERASVAIEQDSGDDAVLPVSDSEDVPPPGYREETPPLQSCGVKSAGTEENVDGHLRHSVANSDPQALRDAANQPEVKALLELFKGKVIDLHRP